MNQEFEQDRRVRMAMGRAGMRWWARCIIWMATSGTAATKNLVYLCQKCHLHVQAKWKPGDEIPGRWGEVPGWILKRGLPYREPSHKQLQLI